MKTIIEGDLYEYTETVPGDETNRDITITGKYNKSDTIPIFSISLADGVANGANTDIAIVLPAANTDGIYKNKIYVDIQSVSKTDSTDIRTVFNKKVDVIITVEKASDSVPVAATPALMLKASDYDEGDRIGKVVVIDGTKYFVGETLAELKTAFGLPSGVYKGRYRVTTEWGGGDWSVTKYTPFINTESFTSVITREGVGLYTITIPVSSTSNRVANLFIDSAGDPLYTVRFLVNAGASISVTLYKSGVLADPEDDSSIYFMLGLEWY